MYQNLDESESEPVLVNYDLLEPLVDNFGLSIAVRKGIRSSIKHHISNFIS
jgi:hypothetical protein